MLIKFCILWVEDNDKYFETTKKNLARFLNGLGFHLEVDRISDPEKTNWETYLENTSKYDLMLVDWRVRTPGKPDKAVGGAVISQIRERIAYSDIIFYSGSEGIDDELSKRKLEGVYLARRTDLREEAKALINYLLHKTLHPKIMTGIIVSSLSQIDDLCFKIISAKFHDVNCDKAGFAETLRNSVLRQANDQHKSREKSTKKGDEEFIASLHSTMLMDSHKRALKLVGFAKEDKLHTKVLTPISELPSTVSKRNKLAHWKRSEETDTHIKLVCDGKAEYVFDQAEATKMRKNINSAASALSSYLENISGEPEDR